MIYSDFQVLLHLTTWRMLSPKLWDAFNITVISIGSWEESNHHLRTRAPFSVMKNSVHSISVGHSLCQSFYVTFQHVHAIFFGFSRDWFYPGTTFDCGYFQPL